MSPQYKCSVQLPYIFTPFKPKKNWIGKNGLTKCRDLTGRRGGQWIKGTLQAKMTKMSDSQCYPWNLYPINTVEDIIVLLAGWPCFTIRNLIFSHFLRYRIWTFPIVTCICESIMPELWVGFTRFVTTNYGR